MSYTTKAATITAAYRRNLAGLEHGDLAGLAEVRRKYEAGIGQLRKAAEGELTSMAADLLALRAADLQRRRDVLGDELIVRCYEMRLRAMDDEGLAAAVAGASCEWERALVCELGGALLAERHAGRLTILCDEAVLTVQERMAAITAELDALTPDAWPMNWG